MNNRKGNWLIVLGLLLLAAALGLAVYNMQTELTAGQSATHVLGALSGLRPGGQDAPGDALPGDGSAADVPALPGNTPGQNAPVIPGNTPGPNGGSPAGDVPPVPVNTPGQNAPGATGGEMLPTGGADMPDASLLQPAQPLPGAEPDSLFVPDYVRFPDMEMPMAEVEGHSYIGTLCIPELGLDLPVMSEWSYPKLKIAPCRFAGSAYQQQLIIVAHNYVTHLGNIKNLPAGSPITFTDMTGNVFCYELAEIEILRPNQVKALMDTDYPLTLVTCTLGGRTRVTARCIRVEEKPAVPEGMILSMEPETE